MSSKKRKQMVSAEDFYSFSNAENPQIHPDGKRIVFVKVTPEYKGKKYKREIYLFDLEEKRHRQITSGGTNGDSMPKWSPDGKKLAFISSRGGKPQVYVMPEYWGEPLQLTNARNGILMFEWAPDSEMIAFSARTREEERNEEDSEEKKNSKVDPHTAKREEDERAYAEKVRIDPRVYVRTVIKQGTAFRDDRNTHIYVQSLNGGKARRLTDGDIDYGFFSWSRDGQKMYSSSPARAMDPDVDIRSDIVEIGVKDNKIKYLTKGENSDFFPHESPDGKWLYYLSFQNKNRHQQIMKIFRKSIADGTIENLLPDYSLDPGMFKLSSDGKKLYFLVGFEGRDSLACLNTQGGEPEVVIRNDGMVTGFSLCEDLIACTYESPDCPGDLYLYFSDLSLKKTPKKKLPKQTVSLPKSQRLTTLNEEIFQNRVVSYPKEIWLERPDGLKIQGWYMLPKGYENGKKYPWIIQVHGGPHVMWGYSWWHEFQAMCDRGYGVYFSNPRGSEGYGHDFKGAIHKKWGEKDSGDILAGADKMVEMGLADPSNLFLTGGSFGGFMTGWIVTHDHRFQAVAAQRGVYNFVSMYGASDALTLVEWEFDTLPWKNTELLWDRSPLKYVENVTSPVLIIHSELDFRVGISQAEEFYTALKRCRKKAKFIRYPREGHELSRSGEPEHRVDRINKIIEWFDEHLHRSK